MNGKVAVERNKTDSTLGIIKKMTFQSEKRCEIYLKVYEVISGMKKRKKGEWTVTVSHKKKNKTQIKES